MTIHPTHTTTVGQPADPEIITMHIIKPTCLVIGLTASTAMAHIHLTVDTISGSPGDAIVIRAGYTPAESAFSIDTEGRIRESGEIAVFSLDDILHQPGPCDGWAIHDPISLTSDFYFATGRLAGGDFRYEIAEVEPVTGSASTMAWGVFSTSYQPEAVSTAAVRSARSFTVGAGGHRHGQYIAIERNGLYDVTLIAWDANGVYGDSAPVIVRISTIPAFCPADLNQDGVVDFTDYLEFLNLFDAGDARVDFNHDGVVDFADYLDFLNLFDAGC